jgi:hypothetical protein
MSDTHDQQEETRRRVDPSGSCAHLQVDYDPIEHVGKAETTYTSRWRCHDCKLDFIPVRLAEYTARAAFPEQETMRDRFAMAALNGMLASGTEHWDGTGDEKRYSKLAYEAADAMLEARK